MVKDDPDEGVCIDKNEKAKTEFLLLLAARSIETTIKGCHLDKSICQ